MEFLVILLLILAVSAALLGIYLVITDKKPKATVTGLFIYPVKSLRSISRKSFKVSSSGFEYDREWMIVDAKNKFLTLRELPQMVMLQPDISEDNSTLKLISMNDGSSCSIPINPSLKGSVVQVRVWSDFVGAIDQGEEMAEWLQKQLKTEGLRLMRFAPGAERYVDEDWVREGCIGESKFPDAFPFLMTSEESLTELNKLADVPDGTFDMRRYRPNIVVKGGGALAENLWEWIQVGQVKMALTKPCVRCKATTVIPDEGKFDDGYILQVVNQKMDTIFGMNGVHRPVDVDKLILVGDPVIVETTRKEAISFKKNS